MAGKGNSKTQENQKDKDRVEQLSSGLSKDYSALNAMRIVFGFYGVALRVPIELNP